MIYMQASEPKWVNLVLKTIVVISLRLGGPHKYINNDKVLAVYMNYSDISLIIQNYFEYVIYTTLFYKLFSNHI